MTKPQTLKAIVAATARQNNGGKAGHALFFELIWRAVANSITAKGVAITAPK